MIHTEKLTKHYGDLVALDNLELHIGAGEVFGLIGPNGAGKSTTLRILATLLRPTSGRVRVAGFDLKKDAAKIRHAIGYVPDFAGVYEDMQVNEYLAFFAAAAGITGKAARGMVRDVLELTELTDKTEAMVDSLSRGMCQRLSIARVLLHDPKVLILDEPASGLSPRGRVEMRMLLKELCAMDKTIIISSHILPELEALCLTVGILELGRMRYKGRVEELMDACRKGNIVHLRVIPGNYDAHVLEAMQEVETALSESGGEGGISASTTGITESKSIVTKVESPAMGKDKKTDNPPAAKETIRARGILDMDGRVASTRLVGDTIEVHLSSQEEDASFIPPLMIKSDLNVHHFSEEPLTLEDAFMRLTTSGV